MVINPDVSQGRSLLGLRPPADLAEEGVAPRMQSAAPVQPSPALMQPAATPPRPTYPVISSGWDSEDGEPRGKSSDAATALKALAVLVLAMVALGLLMG